MNPLLQGRQAVPRPPALSGSPTPPDDQIPYVETGVSDCTSMFHAAPTVHYVHKNFEADKNLYHENNYQATELAVPDTNYKLLYTKKMETAKKTKGGFHVPASRHPEDSCKNTNQHQCFLIEKEAVGRTTVLSAEERTRQLYLQKLKMTKSTRNTTPKLESGKATKSTQIMQKNMVFGRANVTGEKNPRTNGWTPKDGRVGDPPKPKGDETLVTDQFQVIGDQGLLREMTGKSDQFSLADILRENMAELMTHSDLKESVFSVLIVRRHNFGVLPRRPVQVNPVTADRVLLKGEGDFSEANNCNYNPSILQTAQRRSRYTLGGLPKPLQDLTGQTILELDENKVLPSQENDQEVIDRIAKKTFTRLTMEAASRQSTHRALRTTSIDSLDSQGGKFKASVSDDRRQPTTERDSLQRRPSRVARQATEGIRNSGDLGLDLNKQSSLNYRVSVKNYGRETTAVHSAVQIKSSTDANSRTAHGDLGRVTSAMNRTLDLNGSLSHGQSLSRASSQSRSRTKVVFAENHNKVEKITEKDLKNFYNNDKMIFGEGVTGRRLSEIP